MRALLDVNMLIALSDSGHLFHNKARSWWHANRDNGWASCPLTENGYLRIISQSSYPRPARLADAAAQLRAWAVPPRHAFWPDDLSILDQTRIEHDRLLGPRQITDIYLLALAVGHGGRLVTLDRGLSIATVKGAEASNLVMI